MDDFVILGALLVAAALLFALGHYLLDRRHAKQLAAEKAIQDELDRQERKYNAQRERFHRERMSMAPIRTFATTAPTAKATVLKMRKDEPASESIADSIITAAVLTSYMTPPYSAPDPEPVRGQGGTFDGGGSSGDWSPSSSPSGCSSSDSGSSSSSDSGGSCGGGD